MKRPISIDCTSMLYWFGLTLSVGSITSGIISADKSWLNWHFSRLGEGGSFSASIFNVTLLLAAVLFYFFSRMSAVNISKIQNMSGKKIKYAKKILYNLFASIAVCMVVVSFFPFDKFPVIHNIFGYSILFIFIYICLFISAILPVFTDDFYKYGYSIVLTVIVCYILFLGLSKISLLIVETVIFSLLYIWLLRFTKGVEAAAKINKFESKKS